MRIPDASPEASIVVISYNTRDMTLACLASVYAETRTPFELIVVDNASTDGSAEAIRAAYPADTCPNLTLIAEDTNQRTAWPSPMRRPTPSCSSIPILWFSTGRWTA